MDEGDQILEDQALADQGVNPIAEIERVLRATADLPATNTPGHEIGKALKCLKNLSENDGKALIEEIEGVLKNNKVTRETSEIARLFYSLKQFASQQEKERALGSLSKAYVEYAKNTANAYAALFNAINIFGTSISYVIGDKNKDYKYLSKNPKMVHAMFTGLTLGFLPVSLLTVGMTHALTHKPNWKGKVSWMLMAEVLYMAAMCTLFGLYLMPGTHPPWAVGSALGVAVIFLTILPWCIFKVPNDLWPKIKKVLLCLCGQQPPLQPPLQPPQR